MVLVLGFAAVNTGNNLLFLIVSAQLGFMAVTGLFGWLNIRRLRVSVSFPDEIYCGRETLVSLTVDKYLPLPSFLIRLQLSDSSVLFPVICRGNPSTLSAVATFDRRGKRRIESCTVSSIFPVNFFVRYKNYHLDASVIVFPEPKPFYDHAIATADGDGDTESARRGYEGDVAKIADYSGSEPPKLIHWRLSAKHDTLKVKEMTALDAQPVVLDLELIRGRDVEERLSRTAYLVNRLVRQNRPVGLRLGNRLIPPALSRSHRLLLLRELAVHGQN